MATRRQIEATRENLKRAQDSLHEMNHCESAPGEPTCNTGTDQPGNDRFRAQARISVAEPERLTSAQREARRENIKKAQRARSYESWTKKELYERAAELGIAGRSQMAKCELIVALRARQ